MTLPVLCSFLSFSFPLLSFCSFYASFLLLFLFFLFFYSLISSLLYATPVLMIYLLLIFFYSYPLSPSFSRLFSFIFSLLLLLLLLLLFSQFFILSVALYYFCPLIRGIISYSVYCFCCLTSQYVFCCVVLLIACGAFCVLFFYQIAFFSSHIGSLVFILYFTRSQSHVAMHSFLSHLSSLTVLRLVLFSNSFSTLFEFDFELYL